MNATLFNRIRTTAVAMAAAFALTLAPNAWAAHVVTEANFDTLDLGSQVRPDLASDFTTRRGVDIGNLVGSVYFNSGTGTYTYAFELTPGINNISEFNTGYDIAGFTGVAGWSWSQADAAGGSPGAASFNVEHESDGTIDWATRWNESGSKGFDSGEMVTFFFQSTLAPGALDTYNLINSKAGTTDNYAPGAAVIPAPAAFPAGLLLLGALAAARRRFRIA